MTTKSYVRLTVVSNSDNPDELSQFLGMQFDHGWRIGDKRPNTIIQEKDHGWSVDSGLTPDAPLEEHFSKLFERVGAIKEKIEQLSKSAYVEVSCAIYSSSVPAIHLDREIIREAASLGACVDIDLYIVEID